MSDPKNEAPESDREAVSVRIVNASKEAAFRAWTDPNHLRRWWGPKGFTNTFYEYDLKPGGNWKFTMHGPDGTDYPNHSVFVSIVPSEELVFDHISGHPFRVTTTFEEQSSGKTKITFRMLFETAEEFERSKKYVIPGNEENFDKLEAELAEMVNDV
ncbi:polyketide cyclase [Leptospira gomenensis]|uniref:Polyketide cyclase n=1 Tax=Leptospira gomenensis TaxID=2484974 RepID=A0A5F1YZN9_9LEPT|nr:SRPBCC family protein [Leptospira gomenensis]TGK29437.1 polyketide cyclase [Leptospira gomenensis]TGK33660.1 polyketide cyclase [Leptospira gomenensis]TGK44901.1 polyketide cyclase [Leptospira gomenensis]TGK64522.1 polyketide cyclase [Leptospira gomenensis]